MSAWNELHHDPRISYYLFLRKNHGLSAREAHARVKRTDAMVVGLQGDRRRTGESLLLSVSPAWCLLLKFVGRSTAYAERALKPSSRPASWGKRWSDMRPSAS
jgi:hypothetical protein